MFGLFHARGQQTLCLSISLGHIFVFHNFFMYLFFCWVSFGSLNSHYDLERFGLRDISILKLNLHPSASGNDPLYPIQWKKNQLEITEGKFLAKQVKLY